MIEQQFGKNTWRTPSEVSTYVKRRWLVKWDGAEGFQTGYVTYDKILQVAGGYGEQSNG